MAVYLIIFGAAVLEDGTPSGSLARRVEGAITAAKAHAGAVFMPTGGRGASGFVEAEVMRDMLIAAGIAAERIVVEGKGRDTLESVRLCDALLRQRSDVSHVEPCTSRYHIPRCTLLLRLIGWRVCKPQMPSEYGHLPIGMLIRFTLKEVVALPYDALLLVVTRAFTN